MSVTLLKQSKKQEERYFYIHNHKQFLLLIIIFSSLLNKKMSNKNPRFLNSFFSQIHLVIKGSGNQSIIYHGFNYTPSEVIVNGVIQEGSNLKNCILEEEVSNITLRFNHQFDSLSKMFYNLTNITKIDLSEFNTSEVINMESMFRYCTNLETIILGDMDTSSVQNMKLLFSECNNLTNIDLTNFDTSSVNDTSYMFARCYNLPSLNLSNFNTSKVEAMFSMFNGCQKLEYLDLSFFDTSKVKTMQNMFLNCKSLKNISFGNINTSLVEDMTQLFSGCFKLTSINLTSFDTSKVKNMASMFKKCSSLKAINLENIDVSNVENMNSLFSGCSALESINLSKFDTSKVTDMSSLFSECERLTSIDLSNFNTSLVSNMKQMFNNCYLLKSINFSDLFNTSQVKSMSYMFNNCNQLTSINLSNFDTTKVTEMEYMFSDCYKLQFLDLSHFYCDDITTIKSMFKNCESLIFLNLNSFNINNKTNTESALASISSFIKFCSNDTNMIQYLLEPNNFTSDCTDICFTSNTKLDLNNSQCICEDNFYVTDNNPNLCYNETPEGYYLDLNESIYKECFNSCKTCDEPGNEIDNKCKECKQNYTFLNDSLNNMNCYKICENYYYFDDSDNYMCTENEICPDGYNKLIRDKNKCIDDCKNDDTFKYDYNNTCVEICPSETFVDESNKLCLTEKKFESTFITLTTNEISPTTYEISPTTYEISPTTNEISPTTKEIPQTTYEISPTTNEITPTTNEISPTTNEITPTINEISPTTYNFAIEDDSNYSNNMNAKDSKTNQIILTDINNIEFLDSDEVLKYIQNILSKEFNTTNIDKGIDYIYTDGKATFTITTPSNQRNNSNPNSTLINLGKCEKLLKDEYDVSEEQNLYIFKIDYYTEDIKGPKVEYEVYYPYLESQLKKANLSLCSHVKIDVSIPIDIPLDDLDKFNASSGLYNDLCYTLTTESNTDKSLEDRRNEFINNNLSICEEDCQFTEYDKISKRAICSCYTKIKLPLVSEIKVDKKKFLHNFYEINNIANFKMMKCIHLLFDKNNIFKNSANYMLVVLFFFDILTSIIFCCYNNQKIKKDINKIYEETKIIHDKEHVKTNQETKSKGKKQVKNLKKNNNNINKNINNNKQKHNELPNKNLNIKKKRKTYFNKNPNRFKSILTTTDNINNNIKNIANKIQKNNLTKDQTNIAFLNINVKSKEKKKKTTRKKNISKDENSMNILKRKSAIFQTLKINNIIKKGNMEVYTDNELNSMDYEEALKYDQRNFVQYYFSLIKNQHLLIFTFFQCRDYNSQMIKLELFLFSYSINYLISAMFYSDDTMHKIYVDEGDFDIIYQLPQMLYSSIISFVLEFALGNLGLYEENITDVRNLKKDKKNLNEILHDVSRCIKIKIAFFSIIAYILTFAFWIYLGCFCAVYKNTQIHLLKEVSSSFFISFTSPFWTYLIPSFLRIISLQNGTNDRPYLYKISKFLQMF